MARTAGQVGMPTNNAMPPPGWHSCECIGTEKWKSPKQGTMAVKLKWREFDSGIEFEDLAFVTPKAIKRLNLIAQRVAGMPETTALPDDDTKCALSLAGYIFANATSHAARVLIEEQIEEFIYQDGPKVGQKGEKKRLKVAFAGYERFVAADYDGYGEQAPPDTDEPPPEDPGSNVGQPPPDGDFPF